MTLGQLISGKEKQNTYDELHVMYNFIFKICIFVHLYLVQYR